MKISFITILIATVFYMDRALFDPANFHNKIALMLLHNLQETAKPVGNTTSMFFYMNLNESMINFWSV